VQEFGIQRHRHLVRLDLDTNLQQETDSLYVEMKYLPLRIWTVKLTAGPVHGNSLEPQPNSNNSSHKSSSTRTRMYAMAPN
jgi:hypothetical protein